MQGRWCLGRGRGHVRFGTRRDQQGEMASTVTRTFQRGSERARSAPGPGPATELGAGIGDALKPAGKGLARDVSDRGGAGGAVATVVIWTGFLTVPLVLTYNETYRAVFPATWCHDSWDPAGWCVRFLQAFSFPLVVRTNTGFACRVKTRPCLERQTFVSHPFSRPLRAGGCLSTLMLLEI